METKEERHARQNKEYLASIKELEFVPNPTFKPVQELTTEQYGSRMKPFSAMDVIKKRVSQESVEEGFVGVEFSTWLV